MSKEEIFAALGREIRVRLVRNYLVIVVCVVALIKLLLA
jgi:hypothetical protein